MEKFDVCNDKLPNTPTKSTVFRHPTRLFRVRRVHVRAGAAFYVQFYTWRITMESAGAIVTTEIKRLESIVSPDVSLVSQSRARDIITNHHNYRFPDIFEKYFPDCSKNQTCPKCGFEGYQINETQGFAPMRTVKSL